VMAWDRGTMAPPARPWTTRMKIRKDRDWAAPEPREARVKMPRQVR